LSACDIFPADHKCLNHLSRLMTALYYSLERYIFCMFALPYLSVRPSALQFTSFCTHGKERFTHRAEFFVKSRVRYLFQRFSKRIVGLCTFSTACMYIPSKLAYAVTRYSQPSQSLYVLKCSDFLQFFKINATTS
jgi:hypothetical protein